MYGLQTIIALNAQPQRAESVEKLVEVFSGDYKQALLVYVAIQRANLPARLGSTVNGSGYVTSVEEARAIADQYKEV